MSSPYSENKNVESLPPTPPSSASSSSVFRKSSTTSKSSIGSQESWRRKPVVRRKKTLDGSESEENKPIAFSNQGQRHSFYGKSLNFADKKHSDEQGEGDLEKATTISHRRSKSTTSALLKYFTTNSDAVDKVLRSLADKIRLKILHSHIGFNFSILYDFSQILGIC